MAEVASDRNEGRGPLSDRPESEGCVVSHLRGNHEVRGAHSFFTQLDGVSIPSGATRFKRSTTGVKEGARPAVTDRAHNGRKRRRNRLPRVSRDRRDPVTRRSRRRSARCTRTADGRMGSSARTAAAAPAGRAAAARGVAAASAGMTASARVSPVVPAAASAAARRTPAVRAAAGPPARPRGGGPGRRRASASPRGPAPPTRRHDEQHHQSGDSQHDRDVHPPPSFSPAVPRRPAWKVDALGLRAPKHT